MIAKGGNGVVKSFLNELSIETNLISNKLYLKSGAAIINGYIFHNSDIFDIDIHSVQEDYHRKDLLILRLDNSFSTRSMLPMIIRGIENRIIYPIVAPYGSVGNNDIVLFELYAINEGMFDYQILEDKRTFVLDYGSGGSSGGGGGGASTLEELKYTNTIPSNIKVGGIEINTTFNEVSLKEILDNIFHEYKAPSFSSFYIENVGTILECGRVLNGQYNLRWTTTNIQNVKPNSIKIMDTTRSEVLMENTTNDSLETITLNNITKNGVQNHIFTISARDIKDNTFSRTFTIRWIFKIYFGESEEETLDSNGILNLRQSLLSENFKTTYSFISGGYKYIAFPTSYGSIATIKDVSTGFEIPVMNLGPVIVQNIYGISTSYHLYRTYNKIGSEINAIVT